MQERMDTIDLGGYVNITTLKRKKGSSECEKAWKFRRLLGFGEQQHYWRKIQEKGEK